MTYPPNHVDNPVFVVDNCVWKDTEVTFCPLLCVRQILQAHNPNVDNIADKMSAYKKNRALPRPGFLTLHNLNIRRINIRNGRSVHDFVPRTACLCDLHDVSFTQSAKAR